MNVDFDEWAKFLADLGQQVTTRWPYLSVSVERGTALTVGARNVMSGTVNLQIDTRKDDCMVPVVTVGSSGSLSLDLSVAQAELNDMQSILDALHFCKSQCEGYRVFSTVPDPEGF